MSEAKRMSEIDLESIWESYDLGWWCDEEPKLLKQHIAALEDELAASRAECERLPIVESEFQRRMRQSMAVFEAYPHKVDAIASLRKRLHLYEETGNAEYLVDVANFAMIEFMHPAHEAYHDYPTDGEPTP